MRFVDVGADENITMDLRYGLTSLARLSWLTSLQGPTVYTLTR
jgi:hypothetical protein